MRRHIVMVGTLLAALGAVAGCSAGPGSVFNNEGGQKVSCLTHQTEAPGTRYTGAPDTRNTAEVLSVTRYFTAYGNLGYCDKAAATDVDKAWAKWFVETVGPSGSEKVKAIVG